MKVTQESPAFKPVTITLETPVELSLLYQLLNETNLILTGYTQLECQSLYDLHRKLHYIVS